MIYPFYNESVTLQPPVILGQQLLPFCCAHLAFLDRYSVELDLGDGDAYTFIEMATILMVCTRDYKQNCELSCRDDLGDGLFQAAKDAGKLYKRSHNSYAEAVKMVHEYSCHFSTAPDVYMSESPNKDVVDIPVYITIPGFLQRVYHMTVDEAYNCPLSYAIALTHENLQAIGEGDKIQSDSIKKFTEDDNIPAGPITEEQWQKLSSKRK